MEICNTQMNSKKKDGGDLGGSGKLELNHANGPALKVYITCRLGRSLSNPTLKIVEMGCRGDRQMQQEAPPGKKKCTRHIGGARSQSLMKP